METKECSCSVIERKISYTFDFPGQMSSRETVSRGNDFTVNNKTKSVVIFLDHCSQHFRTSKGSIPSCSPLRMRNVLSLLSGHSTLDYEHLCSTETKSKLCYDRRSVGQSVLVSSIHLGPDTRVVLLPTITGLLMWGALFDGRAGLSFTIAAGPRQHSHTRVPVQRD
jgi:hypothetical protein